MSTLQKIKEFLIKNWLFLLILFFSYVAMLNAIEASKYAQNAYDAASDASYYSSYAADYAEEASDYAEEASNYASEAADYASEAADAAQNASVNAMLGW